MSLQKLGNERLTHYDCGIVRKAYIFTVKSSAPAAQRISQVKWLTPVKPEKNACPASALFHCSVIRSDAADAAAADHKATPPPPIKNARRAASHKTTQCRRRPPVRRRTALCHGYPRKLGQGRSNRSGRSGSCQANVRASTLILHDSI